MNISFTNKQEAYIADQIQSGDYQNAAEVVREALRLHEVYRNRLISELREEIDKGWEYRPTGNSVLDVIAQES